MLGGSTWCDPYPDPFRSAASLSLPVQFRRVLRWCEQAWLANRTYAKTIERTVAYFMTEVDATKLDSEEALEWRQLATNVLNFPTEGRLAVEESFCYGSGFVSFVIPFVRFLCCPNRPGGRPCGWVRTLRAAAEDGRTEFTYDPPKFVLRCPDCRFRGPFRVHDVPHNIENDLRLRRWSPHEIETVHNLETLKDRVMWRIPQNYAQTLKRSDCDLFHLEQTNLKVLDAVCEDALFEFHRDTIYQIKQPTLSGLPLYGWGCPDPLLNKDRIYLLQVLRRTSEALGLDYAIPWRVICPAPRQGSGGAAPDAASFDPYFGVNPQQVKSFIDRMIALRKQDPAAVHSSPVPVQYQVFGADLNTTVPIDLLKFEEEGLLRDAGPPMELWQGTLSLQATPVALRLMESTYSHIAYRLNDMIRWVGKTGARLLNRKTPDLSLRKVTMADDIDRHVLALNLLQMGLLAPSDVLRSLGWDYDEQQKRIGADALVKARAEAKGQEMMQDAGMQQQVMRAGDPAQQAQQGGAPGGAGSGAPGGGAGGAAGGPVPGPSALDQALQNTSGAQTLDELHAMAKAVAGELIGKSPSECAAGLKKLREASEPLHRMVRGEMDQQRSQINSQAGQAARQQMQQQAA